MIPRRTAVGRRVAVLGVIAVIVIAATTFAVESQGNPGASTTFNQYPGGSSSPTSIQSTTTSSTTTATTLSPNTGGSTTITSTSSEATSCVILGQPGQFYLRVIFDSSQAPVVGAQVAATNQPALCNGMPATNQTTLMFTTNGTEWYAFDGENNKGYSFVFTYQGHNYEANASLRPVSVTCETLSIPSGQTNTTISEFQSTCAPSTTTSSSSVSEQCTISAESTGFFLHLVTDSTNASIAGVSVTVTPVIECGGDSVDSTLARTYTTNGSGWAAISSPEVSGDYYLVYSFKYSGQDYNFSVSWAPQSGTFTTIHLPSGNISTVYMYPKSCNFTCTY